ncbi:hypothetical protein Taro_020261 [Colocasia esculenta]|uniref:Cytochrome c oxidase subunit 5C n=1 Tax=Colocasia esculenta TaxID=4460 RepID=A0A843V1L3_COLES|nr:hypothetical protein [Colocasia esculenta]
MNRSKDELNLGLMTKEFDVLSVVFASHDGRPCLPGQCRTAASPLAFLAPKPAGVDTDGDIDIPFMFFEIGSTAASSSFSVPIFAANVYSGGGAASFEGVIVAQGAGDQHSADLAKDEIDPEPCSSEQLSPQGRRPLGSYARVGRTRDCTTWMAGSGQLGELDPADPDSGRVGGVGRLQWSLADPGSAREISATHKKQMAAHKIAHATLKGPSVLKEICIGFTVGLFAGGLWKMHHWNEQRKVKAFYDMLDKDLLTRSSMR